MKEEDDEKIGAPELDPEIDRVAKKEDEDSSPDKLRKLIEAAIGGHEKEGKTLNAVISHADFLRGDCSEAAKQPGDEGVDGERGGISQNVDNVLQHADINMVEYVDEDEVSEDDEAPNENTQNLAPVLDSVAEEVDVFECETHPIQESPVPIRIRSNVIPAIPSGDSSVEENRNMVLSCVRADTTHILFLGSGTRPAQEPPRPDCVASRMMPVAVRQEQIPTL